MAKSKSPVKVAAATAPAGDPAPDATPKRRVAVRAAVHADMAARAKAKVATAAKAPKAGAVAKAPNAAKAESVAKAAPVAVPAVLVDPAMVVEVPAEFGAAADAFRAGFAAGNASARSRKARTAVAPRAIVEKADPADVAAYFASTGLNRKELAGIVGVGVGVIATVQNVRGDRWSAARFEAARSLIGAHLVAHPAPAADPTA